MATIERTLECERVVIDKRASLQQQWSTCFCKYKLIPLKFRILGNRWSLTDNVWKQQLRGLYEDIPHGIISLFRARLGLSWWSWTAGVTLSFPRG